jgi:hypothetical protein
VHGAAATDQGGHGFTLCRTTGVGCAVGAGSASGAGFGTTGRICASSNARSCPSAALLTR